MGSHAPVTTREKTRTSTRFAPARRSALEAAFAVAIPDADLTPENFVTVFAIEAMIARLLPAGDARNCE